MPDNTQPTDGKPTEAELQAMVEAAFGNVPVPMSSDQEYDAIMAEINPELTTANITTIAATVANETPEQKAARAERYTNDFVEFEKRMGARAGRMAAEAAKYYRIAFASLEQKTKAAEENAIINLEASFQQAA